jgi:pimeloyl-ACP methyl ester carboxylesterase
LPTGVAVFPNDVAIHRFRRTRPHHRPLVEFARGGHFAALEAPDLFVQDVRASFGDLH